MHLAAGRHVEAVDLWGRRIDGSLPAGRRQIAAGARETPLAVTPVGWKPYVAGDGIRDAPPLPTPLCLPRRPLPGTPATPPRSTHQSRQKSLNRLGAKAV
jgi:hypothetical protein